jgi:hypothetical protein
MVVLKRPVQRPGWLYRRGQYSGQDDCIEEASVATRNGCIEKASTGQDNCTVEASFLGKEAHDGHKGNIL